MARILIIGGTRFIGRALADATAARGDEVVLFNRGHTAGDAVPYRQIHGDVRALDRHRDALRALRPDAVVHCIAYSEQDGERAVAAFAGLRAPLVVLGSQDCYHGFHAFRDGRERTDFPLDEHAPLASRHYWDGIGHPIHAGDEAYDKNLLTEVLLGAGRRGDVVPTVLRLPMVWGPRDPQFAHRHGDVIWHLLDGRTEMVIGQGEQARIFTYGYVENIAAAVLHAVDHPAARNAVFNVGETRVRTRRRWADRYAAAAGTSFRYRVVPDLLLDPAGDPDAAGFHLITDNSAFVRATGFTDPVNLDEGIARTLAWAGAHRDRVGGRPDYAARNAAADRWAALRPR